MRRRRDRCKWVIRAGVDTNHCQKPAHQDGYCRGHYAIRKENHPIIKGYNALQNAMTRQRPMKEAPKIKPDEGFYR